jgi:hypothetical protein
MNCFDDSCFVVVFGLFKVFCILLLLLHVVLFIGCWCIGLKRNHIFFLSFILLFSNSNVGVAAQ